VFGVCWRACGHVEGDFPLSEDCNFGSEKSDTCPALVMCVMAAVSLCRNGRSISIF